MLDDSELVVVLVAQKDIFLLLSYPLGPLRYHLCHQQCLNKYEIVHTDETQLSA